MVRNIMNSGLGNVVITIIMNIGVGNVISSIMKSGFGCHNHEEWIRKCG